MGFTGSLIAKRRAFTKKSSHPTTPIQSELLLWQVCETGLLLARVSVGLSTHSKTTASHPVYH